MYYTDKGECKHKLYWKYITDLKDGEIGFGLKEYNLVLWCFSCDSFIKWQNS
jgi:hypothetical protein